jgi:nucleotide-binding universal stress UspA family protein
MIARDHALAVCLFQASTDERELKRAGTALERTARELAADFGIDVHTSTVAGDPLREAVRMSREAGLVVIGSGRANTLRERVLGTQAERLIRLSGTPVLVVKRPSTAGYRRVLVPVDFGPDGGAAIAAAAALTRNTRIEVFHALRSREEVTMRTADVPEAALRRYRQRAMDRARARAMELIRSVGAARLQGVPSIVVGDASAMVLAREQAMRADLVVIGKRRRGLLADFFLGSVTQRVLAGSRADVLVLTRRRKDDASTVAGLGAPVRALTSP